MMAVVFLIFVLGITLLYKARLLFKDDIEWFLPAVICMCTGIAFIITVILLLIFKM